MARRMTSGLVLLVLVLALATPGLAIEKLKFATSVKASPAYYLPVLAAQEKGFWKDRGLEVGWVPFKGGSAMMRAVVAGVINVGGVSASGAIKAATKGVPVVIVADLFRQEFIFWVRTDSRFRRPQDLKEAKIGIARLGSGVEALGRIVVKSLGLEKEVKFVSTGGVTAALAGLKTGAIDATIQSPGTLAKLESEGVVRELLSLDDYLPKEWVDSSVIASRKFIKERPGMVKDILGGVLKSISYLRQDPVWTKEKMKAMSGYSDALADSIYKLYMPRFTRDGRISIQALENVKKFLIDFGLIPKEKVPAIEDVYTSQFID